MISLQQVTSTAGTENKNDGKGVINKWEKKQPI